MERDRERDGEIDRVREREKKRHKERLREREERKREKVSAIRLLSFLSLCSFPLDLIFIFEDEILSFTVYFCVMT